MAETHLSVPCTRCGIPYPVETAEAGHVVACPHCGNRFALAPPADQESAPLDETERQLIQLALRLHLLNPKQAAEAASLPKPPKATGGARFVAAGLLTGAQVDHLLATLAFKQERIADSRFGSLAVDRNWATPEQITAALEEQKRLFLQEGKAVLLGTILVAHQVLTEEQKETLLLQQSRARDGSSPLSAKVIVTHDHMHATLVLHGGEEPLRVDALRELLIARGIVHGIDESTLEAIASGELAAAEGAVVATGTPPTPPQPASIEYLFDTHPLKGARERGEGLVDYRDRGDVPQVAAGSVLAHATAPTPGIPGTNVLGHPIDPPKAKESPLKVGKGVELAADKLSALATIDGRPSLSATGVLSVYPEYAIKGDVDNNTGHVNFHGRVVVSGTVRSGFRVRCGELVANEIEGADVEAEGDVTVSGGIIRAHIRAGGVLHARYLHQSRVEVLGDVVVGREVVDSEVESSGVFDSPDCVVLASRISAMNGVQAREIGSESSTPCHLISGVDERVQKENARLQEAVEAQDSAAAEIQHRIDAAAARNAAIVAEMGPLAQLQDRALVRLRELQKARSASPTESSALRQQARMAESQLNALLAEQEQLRTQGEADSAALIAVQETRAALATELADLKEWAAGRAGNFLVHADLVHQQTLLTGPHLEVRLESDRKAANLIEREHTDKKGHIVWQFVSS